MLDNQTNLTVGEGFLLYATSAGNIVKFNDPASYTYWLANNQSSVVGTPDNKMTYNDMKQSPTTY